MGLCGGLTGVMGLCAGLTGVMGLCAGPPQVDIPNILKQRKQLAKLVLDYDSARARCVLLTAPGGPPVDPIEDHQG